MLNSANEAFVRANGIGNRAIEPVTTGLATNFLMHSRDAARVMLLAWNEASSGSQYFRPGRRQLA